jgi:hypothetical protein
MSFRNKDKKGKKSKQESTQETTEGDDVEVVHAKDSQTQHKSAKDQSSEQAARQQTSAQQSGQESGQPPAQTNEQTSDEQQTSDGDEDEDDDSSDDAEPVPDGTTAEILRWVGGDKKRAQAALDKEQADDRPRHGLTGELKKVLE